jgi:hypothetical protein
MSGFIVTDLPTRRRIREAVRAFGTEHPEGRANPARVQALLAGFHRSLILQNEGRYAVLLFHPPTPGGVHPLEMLCLRDPGNPTADTNEFYESDVKGSPKADLLHEWLEGFIQVQAARLEQLDPAPPAGT